MLRFPRARDQEFEHLLALSELRPGQLVCDIPCGGNYLSQYVEEGIRIVGVDACPTFISGSPITQFHQGVSSIVSHVHDTGLQSALFDRVLSLAGIHHMADKKPFFHEVARLLKTGGRFCIADVPQGSATSLFLDDIVNAYNSMGHEGDYVNDTVVDLLGEVGLKVDYSNTIAFHWLFDHADEMVAFCSQLFGLDKLEPQTFLQATENLLTPVMINGRYCLPWKLHFVAGFKPGKD